jgi:2-amino-4-hydroxy-6-hydroxymethyldihydropteridine diphosphokinase
MSSPLHARRPAARRRPATAYIGLGSNLGDRKANLAAAARALEQAPGIHRLRLSRLIDTAPVGKTDQPRFLNAVAQVRTTLAARELLELLLAIEARLGRVRGERWGPRTVDLDLLLYGREIIREPDLTVPHPRLHERTFVLGPLAEIAPRAVHPVFRKSAAGLLRRLG